MKNFRTLSLLIILIFSTHLIKAQSAASCLNFDGTNDFVNLPNNSGVFNVGSNHIKTVQFWYKSNSTSGAHVRIFSTGSAGWTSGLWLGFASGSSFLMLEMSDGVSTGQVVTSTVSTRGDNNWHHATAVLNGGSALLYLDGVLQNTGNISGEGAMNSSGAVHIGNSYNNESGSYFTGNVDELRVWDKPLCATEILNTKDCELTGTENALVAYYQFNQGIFNSSNSSIATLSGSTSIVNTGTLVNFALSGLTSNWTQPGGVTTGNTCSVTAAVNLSISAGGSVICAGQSLMLTASGANSYTWLPSNSIGSVIVVNPTISTNYTLIGSTGSASSGCIANKNFSVSVSSMSLNLSSTTLTLCAGQNATIGASGASTYTWYPPNIASNVITISPSVSTIYTVFASNGICGTCSIVSVNVPTITLTAFSSNSLICAGQSLSLTANGASSYTWLPSNSNNSVIVASPSVNTTYTVIGSNGICNTSTLLNVNVASPFSISVNNQTICSGATATIQANGATSYSWNTGSTSNAINVSPSITTIYTVSGNNGPCTDTKTVMVVVGALPITINTLTLCSGSSGNLTASGANNYTWNTGSLSSSIVVNPSITTTFSVFGNNGTCSGSAAIIVTVASNPTITATVSPSNSVCNGTSIMFNPSGACSYSYSSGTSTLIPTTSNLYTITGINCNNGCLGSYVVSVTVIQPTPILVSSTSSSICSGGSSTLTASGASSYSWSNGSNGNIITVSPNSSTVYSVSGSGGFCSTQGVATISVIPTPTLSVFNQTICSGITTTISAIGAQNYSWNTGANSSSIIVSPTVVTVYTVVGNNSTCNDTKTVSINIGPNLTIPISGPGSICIGNTATLNASGAVSYTWSNGSNNTSIVVNPSVSTVYTISAINSTCSGTSVYSLNINVYPTVSIVGAPSVSICPGGSINLIANGANSYTWSNGGAGSQITVSPINNTNYSVTGITNGCANSASVLVSIGLPLAVSISAPQNIICPGNNATLTASGAQSYSWNTGSTNASIIITPTMATTYSVVGNNNGCTGIATYSILIANPTSININAIPSKTICLGTSVFLNAGGNFNNLNWINHGINNGSITVTPSISTSYTINGIGDINACSNSSVVNITVNNNPITSINITSASCGNTCDGKLNANTVGGISPYTYSLAGSNCSVLPCTNLCAGLYTLYATDMAGCSNFNIFSIANASNNIIANITTSHVSCGTCTDGALMVIPQGGSAPYTYSWSPIGATTALVSGLASGCYTVTIKDAGGCVSSSWSCLGVFTGIDGVVLYENDFILFPNPTGNFVKVQLSGLSFNYQLFNGLGQLLLSENNVKETALIQMEGYSKGIYYLELNVGNAVLRKKVIRD
jgi:hypothetical protein